MLPPKWLIAAFGVQGTHPLSLCAFKRTASFINIQASGTANKKLVAVHVGTIVVDVTAQFTMQALGDGGTFLPIN
jgi:hypothetical protein